MKYVLEKLWLDQETNILYEKIGMILEISDLNRAKKLLDLGIIKECEKPKEKNNNKKK